MSLILPVPQSKIGNRKSEIDTSGKDENIHGLPTSIILGQDGMTQSLAAKGVQDIRW